MDHASTPLFQVLVLLAATVMAVPLFRALRIGPVLGYLTAGVVVGPHALALVTRVEDIRQLAEYGVVFLLFAIGLELNLSRLLAMRRLVFGLGGLQVVLSTAVLAGLTALAEPRLSGPVAVVVGGGLALSSTAVVLQLLAERGELTGHAGRASFAVLLMQDLAVVPLLLLVNALSVKGVSLPQLLGTALLKAVLAIVLIVAAGRLLVRPFLRTMAAARSAEAFAAAALLVVLGTAWVTEQAGLSMALGAFMAGLLLAETEFRHQVEADIQPYRGFLLGLFFMTVGMSLDLKELARHPYAVLVLLTALVAVKAVLLAGLALCFRLGRAVAVHTGLLLAQGGEFAFVVFAQGAASGVLPPDVAAPLSLAVTASMMLSPVLAVIAARLGHWLERQPPGLGRLEDASGSRNHVVIAGFGRVGRTVARLMSEQGIPYVALDISTQRVMAARALGLPVFFADASRAEALRAAGLAHARAVVVTLDRPGAAEHAVAAIKHAFPHVPIFARARDRGHGGTLRRHGATLAVPETIEASLQLSARVLGALGTPRATIEDLLEQARNDDYAGLGPSLREE